MNIPSNAAITAATLAASGPMEGCDTGQGGCGGTHTDCYYREILAAAYAVDAPVIRADVIAEVSDHERVLATSEIQMRELLAEVERLRRELHEAAMSFGVINALLVVDRVDDALAESRMAQEQINGGGQP